MDELRRRFASLDHLRAPDLWDEIELRAAALGSTERLTPAPVRMSVWSRSLSGRSAVFLLVAAVLLVALVAGVMAVGSGLLRLPVDRYRVGPDLGVFEPARGRIVYRVGSHLEAVDPDDPSTPAVIEPADTSPWAMPRNAMPAGWSADGLSLAITDEDHGDFYVMDQAGSLARVPIEELPFALPVEFDACCWFVPSAWLAPDGTKGLAFAPTPQGDPGTLYILDLDDIGRSRAVAIETFEYTPEGVSQPPMPVWSPDGSQVAYIWSKGGDIATPAVGILDLSSGVSRELISGWGLIRQLAWSPDGSQILVVAGPTAPTYNRSLNALTNPQRTSLYLVDIDDGEAHEVAAGHYVAAAWSPDGTQIAAIDYVGGYHRVVVVNADGSGDRQVLAELAGNGDFTGVVWHPVPAP